MIMIFRMRPLPPPHPTLCQAEDRLLFYNIFILIHIIWPIKKSTNFSVNVRLQFDSVRNNYALLPPT